MDAVDVGLLVEKVRVAGVDLSVEAGRIRCRTHDGRRPSLEAQGLLEEVRALGMVAVDFLQREDKPAQPAISGEVHQLDGMNATEASSLIEFIREGKGELIGQFIYHKSTGLFDARVRFLEGWDS